MSTPAYQCESTETAGPTDHEDDRRRATRNDAPVPDEHVETDEEPVPFHPTTSARWIRAERDWQRLHALARRIRDELITRSDEREIWEAWRVRQCPEGFWMRPEARWTGD